MFFKSLLLSAEGEVRGDDCPLHGRTRRRVPHSSGVFGDYAGPERVRYNGLRHFEPERYPWYDLHRPEPGPPFDRQPLRGRSGFYNDDHEPRHHNRRRRLARSSDPWSHRFSSLSLDYYPEDDESLEDNLSLGPRSYDRRRPGIHRDHPSGPYENDYRSPAHSQASWDSAARHDGRGGISRVYGPMSPNRDRTGQYSLHGSSSVASSDLTTWTHI